MFCLNTFAFAPVVYLKLSILLVKSCVHDSLFKLSWFLIDMTTHIILKPQKTIILTQIQFLIETNITIVVNCFTKLRFIFKILQNITT